MVLANVREAYVESGQRTARVEHTSVVDTTAQFPSSLQCVAKYSIANAFPNQAAAYIQCK